jgi:hypothetical protein
MRQHAPAGTAGEILHALEKAITTGTITDLVPEALEEQAHNTLWRSSSHNELTLLKLIPATSTHSIRHEYDRITSFGEDQGHGGFGAFNETTLPLETQPSFERVETYVRLLGETSSTFLLASLEKTIKVEGATGAAPIGRKMVQLNLLRKKNRALYFMDTRTVRGGTGSARFKGLLQQIEEGTDGTEGTSPYGSHVIDMEGGRLTVENIRQKAAQIISLFGYPTCMIMDGFARADLEGSMDAAQRLPLPIQARPFMLGQHIGGITTNGGQMFFHTDNLLAPIHAKGQYRAVATQGAPGAPNLSGAVVTVPTAGVSKWNAADAGNYFWLVTEVKDERESLAARYPTSGTQAVTQGDQVNLTITPSNPTSDSFKVYRGDDSDSADTDAWFAFEVANSNGGGAVVAYDLNHDRPGTSVAFALNIRSESQAILHSAPSGVRSSYALAVEESERFMGQPDDYTNTVTAVELGPTMGVMELAPILATVGRPLLYSACAMQVRNPLQNFVFKNVGSDSHPTP